MVVKKFLIFGFSENMSGEIAAALSDVADFRRIDSTLESIDEFVNSLADHSYSHIIGMGVYSGRDQDRIRIETECTSKFRNQDIDHVRLAIPHFFQEDADFKLARGIGISWCNLISYRLLKAYPNISYTFLHIPLCRKAGHEEDVIRCQFIELLQ